MVLRKKDEAFPITGIGVPAHGLQIFLSLFLIGNIGIEKDRIIDHVKDRVLKRFVLDFELTGLHER